MATTSQEKVYTGKNKMTLLMVGIVCAVAYGVSLWATSFLPTIPGVTWLRPANMLSEIFAVNFGYTGSLAVMFGNSFGDLLRNQLNPTQLWYFFPVEFLFTAAIVYWGVTDPSLRTLRGKIEWLVFAVVLQGLFTGFSIAWGVTYLYSVVDKAAFVPIGTTITLNEAIPAVAAGFLQYLLFPRIVKMGLWWGRNLEKSNVPKDFLASLRS